MLHYSEHACRSDFSSYKVRNVVCCRKASLHGFSALRLRASTGARTHLDNPVIRASLLIPQYKRVWSSLADF